MAIAPLTPVPATKHMTVLYSEGSASEKYGPSSLREISTPCDEQMRFRLLLAGSIRGVLIRWLLLLFSPCLDNGLYLSARPASLSVHWKVCLVDLWKSLSPADRLWFLTCGPGKLSGLPRLRKRNWIGISSRDSEIILFWEARGVIVVKGWSSREEDNEWRM